MAKQQDCTSYEPGYVEQISGDYISNMLSRTDKADNQRCTDSYYIYANDNLLGGR